jgi:membrane-associated phospholipid phosphatase
LGTEEQLTGKHRIITPVYTQVSLYLPQIGRLLMGRAENSRDIRISAATLEYDQSQGIMHPTNGDEQDYNNTFIGNYSKGLHHNSTTGEVIPQDYIILKKAADNEDPVGFGAIPQGFTPPPGSNKKYFKLTNPISGLSFDLEGPDSHALSMRAPPKLRSDDAASEMAELYWMALCRDIDFTDFDNNNIIRQVVDSLNQNFFTYSDWPSNPIIPATVFRGNFKGDNIGPFVSQFLLKGNHDEVLGRDETNGFVKYGTASYDQRIVVGLKDKDYMSHYDSWLAVQNGEDRNVSLLENDPLHQVKDYYDSKPRFIRNMRDLASYVHFDKLYQAYLTALVYLTRLPSTAQAINNHSLLDPGNPYLTNVDYSNQQGFGTFGSPHILTLLTEVATRALKAAWYQKWFVHRRLRPEAFGGLIHLTKIGTRNYPISNKILKSGVLDEIARKNKNLNEKYDRHDKNPPSEGKYYLLPMAFPEGSPTHPSYPAGHATVAGACVTVLKAWYNEDYPIQNPVIPYDDGTKLRHYGGSDKNDLTLGGELNKLAANIAIGRNMAGVHYRSDYVESVKLGEMVAIDTLYNHKVGILQDQRNTCLERGYSFTLKKEYRFADTQNDLVIKHD